MQVNSNNLSSFSSIMLETILEGSHESRSSGDILLSEDVVAEEYDIGRKKLKNLTDEEMQKNSRSNLEKMLSECSSRPLFFRNTLKSRINNPVDYMNPTDPEVKLEPQYGQNRKEIMNSADNKENGGVLNKLLSFFKCCNNNTIFKNFMDG